MEDQIISQLPVGFLGAGNIFFPLLLHHGLRLLFCITNLEELRGMHQITVEIQQRLSLGDASGNAGVATLENSSWVVVFLLLFPIWNGELCPVHSSLGDFTGFRMSSVLSSQSGG